MVSRNNEWEADLRTRAKEEDCPIPESFDRELAQRLAELPEKRPVSGRRRGRRLVVLAASALLLMACTGAAALTLSQGRFFFFDNEEDLIAAATSAARAQGSDTAGYGEYGRDDYHREDMLERARIWLEEDSEDIVEVLAQAQGTPEDGWTRMRTVRSWWGDVLCEESYYQGDSLSGLAGVWSIPWELDWLEEHYQARPGAHLAHVRRDAGTGEVIYVDAVGEYEGENGAIFNLQYLYQPGADFWDEFMLTEGMELTEQYETRDGAVAAIAMAKTETGKTFFWVDYRVGEIAFSMGGTQLELEDIHAIVDSLNLSALGATRPGT